MTILSDKQKAIIDSETCDWPCEKTLTRAAEKAIKKLDERREEAE